MDIARVYCIRTYEKSDEYFGRKLSDSLVNMWHNRLKSKCIHVNIDYCWFKIYRWWWAALCLYLRFIMKNALPHLEKIVYTLMWITFRMDAEEWSIDEPMLLSLVVTSFFFLQFRSLDCRYYCAKKYRGARIIHT